MRKLIITESQFKKLIKHKWNKVEDRKLKHFKCERCGSEKYWDPGFQRQIFYDRFGKLHYHTPSCVLPNTKLNEQIERIKTLLEKLVDANHKMLD